MRTGEASFGNEFLERVIQASFGSEFFKRVKRVLETSFSSGESKRGGQKGGSKPSKKNSLHEASFC